MRLTPYPLPRFTAALWPLPWLLPVLLLGCRNEPRRTAPTASTPVRSARRPALRTRPPNPCEGSPKTWVVGSMPRLVSYYCTRGYCTGPRVGLYLHNCTGRAERLMQVQVRELSWPTRPTRWGRTVQYNLVGDPLLPGGQIFREVSVTPAPGNYRLALKLTLRSGQKIRLKTTVFRTRNGSRYTCRKRGCLWQGRFCNCPTGDKGSLCKRGSECEGLCLHTGFRVVRKGRCKGPGPTPLGYAIGRCSAYRYRRVKGCYLFLRRHASATPRILCRVPVARSCGGCVISNSYFIDPTAPKKPRPRPRKKRPAPLRRGGP
jgi:hypothetical protein